MPNHLNIVELVDKLVRYRGLIPVAIDVENDYLTWRDLGQFHSYEGFFKTSLNTFSELNRKIAPTGKTIEFRSSLDVLDSDEILMDCIYPSGFIFHAGRCGSTLLLKALARSRHHLVIGEADVHNGVWGRFTRNWTEPPSPTAKNIQQYRRLILATGRKRLAAHQSYFVKFTSFNILMLDFIQRSFPGVPAIFLYREPTAVLRSFDRSAPSWLKLLSTSTGSFISGWKAETLSGFSPLEFIEGAVQNFLLAATKAEGSGLRYLNYESLLASNLPLVLKHFKVETTSEELAKMQAQFEYDAKSEYSLRRFDEIAKERNQTGFVHLNDSMETELGKLYQYMTRSEMNIV